MTGPDNTMAPSSRTGASGIAALLAGARRMNRGRRWSSLASPYWSTLAYTLRTMLAIGIALSTAFALQLQSPMSAVTTVLIVVNPVTGALISKSLWRLFGTLLGAVVAVALMSAFAQAPLLFTVALSLCIGAACVVASLLRYFKAYGAVLAGYTIIIVASSSFAQPLNIFTGALSRVSAVSVGIVSAALVFLLTSLPQPSTLALTIETLVRDIASGFVLYRQPGAPGLSGRNAKTLPRTGLLLRASALDETIEYAGADSYVLRRRMGRLRLGAARLLGLLSTLEPLHDALARTGSGDASRDLSEAHRAQTIARETMQALSQLPPGGLLGSLPMIDAARVRIDTIAIGLRDPAALTVTLHERDLLSQLSHAVADLTDAGSADTRIRLRPYLDWTTALRNGFRGALVTLIGGLFWYVTQWTAGPTMLSFLVPAACLLSTNPSASKASVELATGALLAIPASMVFQTFLVPQISGFPLLWGALCLCLLPGIWLQYHPVQRGRAFGYAVFFNAMINVHNPITFDDISLLNNWEAFLLGCICLVMVFRVLLPANPRRDIARLAASLGRAIELLSWQRPVVAGFGAWPLQRWEVWQNLQMQKIQRMIQRLQQMPGLAAAPLVQAAFATVALGRVILTLQQLQSDPALPEAGRDAARQALRALRRVRMEPARVASRINRLEHELAPLLAPDPSANGPSPISDASDRGLPALVGTLGEAVLLIEKARGLLDRRCPDLAAA
ncbi:FUSC family protein [Lichenicola cladoniae]|uniref:FUSC family protein n=1 Tax=Lichenicola cladoniae TaxID=1484109 RepID=A0A6M8HUK6_9PROT|nr:FUSC family protein [Lichenicola cladoniae]NPD69357.1 FUSC family protein [Acetobacteraceae bacterium]QKE92254.1 FUSC family protein [Lichenicola cladoniae]